jgi:uncharacterized protein
MTEVLLDTSFAIALAAKGDHHFEKARELSLELRQGRTKMVTTRAVMLEIGNALAGPRHRQAAIRLLTAMAADPLVEIVPLTESLYERGWELYRHRLDKKWSLVDCTSFVLMEDRGILEALTTDEHFDQAGFRALLRER